ncbi:AAA family ATPase [candidate division KSB1 bacterium]|nr:AAA family ATPase [candidate division KSB1 bacterium]
MRLKKINLINFGPFKQYEVPFVVDHDAVLLLTGKNNEGKSNIIFALKLLNSALKSIGKSSHRIILDDEEFFRLPQQDVANILIGRMLHNYLGSSAEIRAQFSDNISVFVYLDENRDIIYADYDGHLPRNTDSMFGFVPPLGPLAEEEERLTLAHLRRSISTSLSPRHLRNHFAQILTREEFSLVQRIIRHSWQSVELLDFEYHPEDNTYKCFYREGRFDREIAWAGQGLQVWFQIISHLVRLRHSSILILDEPEINLHPEKQNDLVRILRDYYNGTILIATHSVELMNNVSVSHIIHVQKASKKPKIKTTDNRANLELVRSQIGSNFNLVASQFEAFELIIFTEDTFDFEIIDKIAKKIGIKRRAFNIPLHGFSEYRKAIYWCDAYNILIGRQIPYTVLLDRDYYPEDYLCNIKSELEKHQIMTEFTPGKEIENCFLEPRVLQILFTERTKEFDEFWENLFESEYLDCYGSFLTLHEKFLEKNLDTKTITKKYTPHFKQTWDNKEGRYNLIAGKKALSHVKQFYREQFHKNLSLELLIDALTMAYENEIRQFINKIYQI